MRLLASCLLLTCLSGLPSPIWADTPPVRVAVPAGASYAAQEEQGRVKIVVFDANPAPGAMASAGFVHPIPVLHSGAAAEIRVYNLNSFLNTYDVSFCRQDFHTAGPPAGMGSLLVSTRGMVSRGARDQTAQTPALSNANLDRDSREFNRSFQKYQAATAPIRQCAAQFAAAINDPAATNSSIRYQTTQAMGTLFPEEALPQTSVIASEAMTSASGAVVSVTDYAPNQQADLERLRQRLREYDISGIAADAASLKLWSDQWNRDFQALPAPDDQTDAANDRIQQAAQTVLAFGAGDNTLAAVLAVYTAAIDQAATPPFAVKRVDSVTGADIEEVQVSVNGKPPTGPYAQVNLENSRIGVPGEAGQTYLADAHVYGRGVLDFSAGLSATTLQNKNYYGEPSGTGTSAGKIVRRGSSDGADIAAGILTTYYKTTQSGVALGPSFGVSVGSTTRYLLGASVILTVQRSRLLLTLGGASGNVTELANGDSVGQPARTGTVSTSSVQRLGGFVALTWSLFSE